MGEICEKFPLEEINDSFELTRVVERNEKTSLISISYNKSTIWDFLYVILRNEKETS